MTALNKQALRQLATDAHELGIIKRYTKGIEANKRFVAIATPLTVLALLDELEAAEKRIAELEREPIATLDVQSGRADGNKFALVYSSAAHKLPDDVYYLCVAAAGIGEEE
ncbi:ead/Ea22-like family protein [Citrobacter youngae]